jgi:tetratricopeptide (TPR) repeat protein
VRAPEVSTQSPPAVAAVETGSAAAPVADAAPERRTVLQRMNPLNVFRRDPPPPTRTTPLPEGVSRPNTNAMVSAVTSAPPAAVVATPPRAAETIRRYPYRSPPKPAAGNATAAQQAFRQGEQAHRANRMTEAVAAYRQAVTHDPAYFDAYYNLGLASVAVTNLGQALVAYENALAIEPAAVDARYSFALALRQAGYPLDAVNELDTILQRFPRDPRTHLALGNIYAYELRQRDKAREHYQRVLENDPRSPQAAAIRDWLAENPR